MKYNFDDCFQTFPPLRSPADLKEVWQEALLDLKKVPVDPRQKLILKKSLGWESRTEVSFQSIGGKRLSGILSIPRRIGKSPVVVSFPDYHEKPSAIREIAEQGLAHLSVVLREPDVPLDGNGQPEPYIQHCGLGSLKKSYPYACFLDAVRCIDFLRLHKSIDSKRIGVLGHGFGGALGVFVAHHKKENVAALALERMGFAWIREWVGQSGSDCALEVLGLLQQGGRGKSRVLKNLDYLDALCWAEDLKTPVLFTVGLEDDMHSPRAAFGFFNHIRSCKTMEIYPDDIRDLRKSRKRSIEFLAEKLLPPE